MNVAHDSVERALTEGKAVMESMGLGDSLGLAAAGVLIVFFILIVLMAVIKILRGIIESMEKSAAAPIPATAVAAPAAATAGPPAGMVPAKGSLGELKLHDVDDKTAAMLMAIVADELKAPLNELRFISIREKK